MKKELNKYLEVKDVALIYSLCMLFVVVASLVFQVIVIVVFRNMILKDNVGISNEELINLISEGMQNSDVVKLISYAISPITLCVVIFTYLKVFNKKKVLSLVNGGGKFTYKEFLLCLLVFAVSFVGLAYLNEFFINFLTTNFGYKASEITLPKFSLLNYILTIICIAVLPAIFEELLFRGILVKQLKNNFSFLGICLMNGILFSLFHLNPSQTPYQFCVGFLFAFLTLKTDSILPSVVLHFLNNFIIVTVYYINENLLNFNVSVKIILSVVGVVLFLLTVVFTVVKNKKVQNKGKILEFTKYSAFGLAICLVMWVSVFLA